MNEFKIDDIQFEILNFLLQNGEVRFTKLMENLSKSENFKNYGVESLKVILLRKIKPLVENGYIQKKDLGHQNVHYLIPQEKLQTVKVLLGKKDLDKNFEKIKSNVKTPEDIEFYKKKLDELEKELKYYKRLNRIKELEQLRVLPLQAVLKKLEQMGFNSEELDFYVEKTKNGERYHYGSRRKITNFAGGAFFDDFKPEDIEIILEPAHKYKNPKDFLTQIAEEVEYGPEWIVLTEEPVKGYYILGAYKELLQLYQEEFEFEWLKWKEEFNLSDEDWKIVGPWVCFKMLFDAGRVDLPIEIRNYLYEYTLYRKPNAFEELKELYTRRFRKREAEAQAEKTIQHFKRLEETPVKELWQEVEENLLPVLNETNRRIFQYLKNKYGESP
jgi:DNA-binding Lrp family transcriptional regulator